MSENNLRRDEAAERARLLSVESYDVELDLTDGSGEKPGEGTFRSRTTARFRCVLGHCLAVADASAPLADQARAIAASVYGTDAGFHGHAKPGSKTTVILGAEYSLSRQWVLAFDVERSAAMEWDEDPSVE